MQKVETRMLSVAAVRRKEAFVTKFKAKVVGKYLLLTEGVEPKAFRQAIQRVGFDVKRRSIVAMSYPRKKALAILEGLHSQISSHLLRLVVLSKSTAASHWKGELETWKGTLRQYNSGKTPSGNNYTEKMLLKWLWEYPLSTDADRRECLLQLKDKGYTVPKTLDPTGTERLKKAVEEFVRGVMV